MTNRLKTTLAGAAAAAASVLLAAGPALAQRGPYGGPYGEHMGWGMGWVFGPLMMLVFFGVFVFLVLLLVRWLWPSSHHAHPASPAERSRALHILEERFARGEIDKAEFEEKRKLLRE